MKSTFDKNPQRASKRKMRDLSTHLDALHSLLESTLAHLDPVDLAVIRLRFDTLQRELDTHRMEAEVARQRMRDYLDRSADLPYENTMEGLIHDEAIAASQSYAQNAIMVAVIALEEAECATLNAILKKVEADQCKTSKSGLPTDPDGGFTLR